MRRPLLQSMPNPKDGTNVTSSIDKIHCGGGVWRLCFHPVQKNLIIAACMHDGIKIIDLNQNTYGLTDERKRCQFDNDTKNNGSQCASSFTLYENKLHESLAYGADWIDMSPKQFQPQSTAPLDDSTIISTCSFYDNLFLVWSVGSP